ncbi:MAG: hypothetical protein IPP71_15100 [Bacteroidetes bacterium]|nr:hypothetical protein [Bacteroidota bacterium]
MGLKDTKIRFSEAEMAFLTDTSLFEKKRNIINKTIALFGEIEQSFHHLAANYGSVVPEDALKKRGKISRGENYKGLPYVILDHPAVFSKDGIFAFRSLMWWGNPFSFTFHISGNFLTDFQVVMANGLKTREFSNTLICINSNQFEHHLGESNYQKLPSFLNSGRTIDELIKQQGFIKIAIAVPLEDIKNLNDQGIVFLEKILDLLSG